jgi:predicted membrane channel-forming protein YqfA (hemolysin III family)
MKFLPSIIIFTSIIAMLLHGVIIQPSHYHAFADQSTFLGLPHAADVLSNIGFAIVAIVGITHLIRSYKQNKTAQSFWAYGVFILSLLLTAVGSSYYHLAPDDARLFWDRLPIALACAGILAAVRLETVSKNNAGRDLFLLCLFAIGSVIWWQQTADLRPYLLLQLLTLLLIPLWQIIAGSPRTDQLAFGTAIVFYIVAKATELLDQQILESTTLISGHSLKHLFAAAAGGIIVMRLMQRKRP